MGATHDRVEEFLDKSHHVPRKLAKDKKRVERQKVSTLHLQQFFNMKDYPLQINARTKKMWEDEALFRKYYLRLVYIANREAPVPLIETYVAAKWREVMASSCPR